MTATAAKTLRFLRESPLIDASFTTRHSEVHIRTGPPENQVYAEVDLTICDNLPGEVAGVRSKADTHLVLVYWKMNRYRRADGGRLQEINDHPYPHTDIEFASDEIDAFATALYQSVQLAKKQGYLPSEA